MYRVNFNRRVKNRIEGERVCVELWTVEYRGGLLKLAKNILVTLI